MAKNNITEEEKQKYKAYFEGQPGIFIIEKFTRDIIERCKLPETIQLRKKLGYDHNDNGSRRNIKWQKKSNFFLMKILCLIKKFNNRKPDIWFKNHNLIEIDEGNHENYDSDDEKEREDMFKKYHFKIFDVIPMILILMFLNFQAK